MSSAVKKIVTDKIISIIEEHKALPWEQEDFEIDRCNYVRRKPYSMLNQIMLYGQSDRLYLTEKEITAHKWNWKTGCNKNIISFWRLLEKETDKKDRMGKPIIKKIPVMRFYKIIGVSDVIGLDIENADFDGGHTDPIDAFIGRTGVKIMHNVNAVSAYYSHDTDVIVTPAREDCRSDAQYYMGICRELIRWTAREDRLNRDIKNTEDYGMEHLVTELGSAMLRKAYNIAWEKSSAAAVNEWLTRFQQDTNLIITAASRAEKAVSYLKSVAEQQEGLDVFAHIRGI